jgi:hypothetical protein
MPRRETNVKTPSEAGSEAEWVPRSRGNQDVEVFHAVFARFRSLKGEFALNAITGKCGPARASGSGGEATPIYESWKMQIKMRAVNRRGVALQDRFLFLASLLAHRKIAQIK